MQYKNVTIQIAATQLHFANKNQEISIENEQWGANQMCLQQQEQQQIVANKSY